MINHSDYSCDKCKRVGTWFCKHCLRTAEKPPTNFKRKKKTGCETPKLRKYTPPPMPPVKPAKKENKTMYGLSLYIPFEDLNTYIHEHTDEKYGDLTFVPVKVRINEVGLSIDIKLLSASSFEMDDCRYKLDLNKLSKENN